nr:uncharacterized mitochondrial protein AtMg00810-like [Tanacetum cinerariifolium]
GVAYQGPTIPTPSKVVKQGTKVTKEQVQTLSSQSTAPIQPPVIQSETQTLVFEPVVAPVSALMPNVKSSIPYPSRRDNERRHDQANEQIEKFYEIFKDMTLDDLGASINIMPLSMWEALSLSELTLTCITLELADRSVSKPIDIAKDVSFKVANYNQMTANQIDVIDMAFEEYSQEVLGFSDVTASGNPTPYDDLIVSTTSPTLAPFGDSDFLLFEEADAFLGLEDDPNLPKINPFYYDPEGDILLLDAIINSEPLPPLPNHEQYLPSFKKELKVCEAKTVKSSVNEPPEMLEGLAGNEFYCFLDGFSGYFQIPIDPRDLKKTTFTCPYGMFAYRCMPFGLCNAPGTFQRDDPIAFPNKAMAFLIVVASLRFPSTNNQLRTSLNLRNQATIQDGTVIVQQVQGRQDLGVPDGQAVQTIIPNNATFHTEDLDTYDSDCDDISNTKAVLMANISNYGSDVILEDFGKLFVLQQELSADEAFWYHMLNPSTETSNALPVKIESPKELPKVILVNESLIIIKLHLASFDKVVKIKITPNARTEGMFKLDLVPLAPKLLQNKKAYIDYLKYTQEQAVILQRIVEKAKAKQPLDNALDFSSLVVLQSYVLTVVDSYLDTKVRDVFQKELQKHTADLIHKYSLQHLPELTKKPTPTTKQESEKSPLEILKIKKEQAESQKTHSLPSSLLTKNPTNHRLYHALMEELIEDENAMDKGVADTVKDHKRKQDDDKDDDDEDSLAEPNQGKKTKRRRTKEFESSKKPSITKETPKGKALTKGSKTGKSASTKEPIEEPIAEVIMDDVGDDLVHDDDQTQAASKPKTSNTLNPEWFKQASGYKLDWNNLEGDRYPVDLSKPLPLQGTPCHRTVAADYFFNNDLEYLKTSDLGVTYTISITMTKAARYKIKGIEDIVPTLWSTIKPDLIYAVCLCAWYQEKPNAKHLNAVKRIFRYLKGTINIGLWYSKDTGMSLTAYADADHAGFQDTRRSTSGSAQFLGDKLVSWYSKKQKSTAISST